MVNTFGLIEITRSASHKVSRQNSFGNWISDELFCSAKAQCVPTEADAVAKGLHAFCHDEISRGFAEIKARLQAQPVDGIPVDGEAPKEPYEHVRPEPEVNPFSVTDSKQAAPTSPSNGATSSSDSQLSSSKPADAAPTPPSSNSSATDVPPTPTEKIQVGFSEPSGSKPESEPKSQTTQGNAPSGSEAEVPAKRRGRPPATAKPEPPPQPETPKTAFVADDSDLPAAITNPVPPTEPTERIAKVMEMPKPQKSQQERMTELTALQAKSSKTTEAIAKAQLLTFLRAFLGVEKVPKMPDAVYDPIIPLLEQIVAQHASRLEKAPGILGKEVAAGWAKYTEYVNNWPAEAKAVATAVVVERFCDDPEMLIGCVDTFTELSAPGVDQLENVVAFLKMLQNRYQRHAYEGIDHPRREAVGVLGADHNRGGTSE